MTVPAAWLLAFFGGAIFVCFIIFCSLMLWSMWMVNVSIRSLTAIIEPIAKKTDLAALASAAVSLAEGSPEIGRKILELSTATTSLEKALFSQAPERVAEAVAGGMRAPQTERQTESAEEFVKKQLDFLRRHQRGGQVPDAPADDSNSGFLVYNEEGAAQIEKEEELRKAGIETNESHIELPDESKAKPGIVSSV